MCEKNTIVNLLNKLASEHKLYWQIRSGYHDGASNNLLEILIYTLPIKIRRGHICYDANTGIIARAHYTGLNELPANQIIDMLLDVLNFEKHRSKTDCVNKASVPAG